MGYTNPLFDLPSAPALLAHPLQKRLALSLLFQRLRAEANSRAEDAWARRNGDMAEFNRALSTYARHMAHLLEQQNPLNVKPNSLAVPASADVLGKPRNPLLRLPAAQIILECGANDRRVIATLLRDLGDVARAEADNSWQRRKAPMAKYWLGVSKHARRTARLLVKRETQKRVEARIVHPATIASHRPVFDLAFLLTDYVRASEFDMPTL